MKPINYILVTLLLASPLLAIFTNHFLGKTLALLWGTLAWMMVMDLWESNRQGIKNDSILIQEPDVKVIEKPKEGNPFG